MLRRAALIAGLALLAACDGPPPPPPTEPAAAPTVMLEPVEGFAHETGLDLAGFYLPTTEVRVGDLKLSHLFIGDDETFEAWEASGGRGATNFPPIMLQFDDLTSETIPNELGGQTPSAVVRVLPSGYGVSSRTVRYAAVDPQLGVVTFEGAFAPASEGSSELRLLGTLSINGQIYEGQGFAWAGEG